MGKLYIVPTTTDLDKKIIVSDDLYIVTKNTGEKKSVHRENVVYLAEEINESIQLGCYFELSYKIMLCVQQILSDKNSINQIVFYNCKYINIYFTVQYIKYCGLNLREIEIIEDNCSYSKIEKSLLYKFPYYWIEKVESECKELLDKKCNKENIEINEKKPLLSIIIPYYNLGEYIDETIQSIKNCTYANYEILIINDGTNHQYSIEILNRYRNMNKIRVIDQENKGLSVARNIGAKEAKGKYIAFLDADDLVDSTYYNRAIQVLESYVDIDIVYSWVEFFESKNEIWPTFNLSLPYLLLSNMSAAFYVIRKEKFLQYGMNREEMRSGMEDYESLIRMHINGCKGVAIPEALVKYRYRMGSMSKAFNPEVIVEVYNTIVEYHKEAYSKYGMEIIKLMNANGPGYLWNNPTMTYPSVCLNPNDDINDVKYILIRLVNTKIGRKVVKLLKKYKALGENR